MYCLISQVTSMEQRQAAADSGSIIRSQKHDNRINKRRHLLVRRLSDVAGDTRIGERDDVTITAASTPAGIKLSAASSPACQMLSSVEKFVFETDKTQSSVTVHVESVSNSLVMLSTSAQVHVKHLTTSEDNCWTIWLVWHWFFCHMLDLHLLFLCSDAHWPFLIFTVN